MSHVLDGVQWWRLRSLPRPPEDAHPTRWMAGSVAPVLSATRQELSEQPGGALLVAWLRPPGAARFELLVGARPGAVSLGAAHASPGEDVPVAFPPGSSARIASEDEVAQSFATLPFWMRCLGTVTEKVESPPSDDPEQLTFDEYAAHLQSPFGWLVVAEPLPDRAAEDEAANLAVDLTMLRRRESSESAKLGLERGQIRYRELSVGRRIGVWRIHVLIGGADESSAGRAAALLCGASELDDRGWALLPSHKLGDLSSTWAQRQPDADGSASPFLMSTATAARLVRGPARELPGIRMAGISQFDVTPETDGASGDSLALGHLLDSASQPAGEFVVPFDTLNRHGFICGATGSGKSQTARGLLEALARAPRPIPWLVVEPAKAEYARMSGRLRGVTEVLVIRPGDPTAVPASLNPLEPEPGFALQSHADLVRSLFLAAFEADEPFPQVLSRALAVCYTEAGWDLVTSRPRDSGTVHYPTVGELQAAARRVVDTIGYGREVAADVRGFVDVRMGSLRQGTPGRFFEGGHPLDVGALLRRPAVLELEGITSDQEKAFLIGALLIRIVEHLRVRAQTDSAPGLRHVLLIEEAHRLLKNIENGPAAAAVELFASMLAEIRAYGQGVVVVEQIPAKILPEVIKNTALKVMHRLPAEDDRKAVGATINLPESAHEAVVAFQPGFAAVALDGWDRPILAKMAPGNLRESAEGCDRMPPLAARRSGFCGTRCSERACRLSEMADATTVAEEPLLKIWAETVAASIVMGLGPPRPRANVLAGFTGDQRLRECALATVVEAAVSARRTALMRWVDPTDFGHRLHETLRALLSGDEPPGGDRRHWRAGAYRWAHVHGALAGAVDQVGGVEEARSYLPHPQTEEWLDEGLFLDGGSLADQLEHLLRDPAYARGSERTAVGDVHASGLLAAVTASAGDPGPHWFAQAIRLTCAGDIDLLIDNLQDLLTDPDTKEIS